MCCLSLFQNRNCTFAFVPLIAYNVSKEVKVMREQKQYLVFDEIERGIILQSLNELRNHLIKV